MRACLPPGYGGAILSCVQARAERDDAGTDDAGTVESTKKTARAK